LKPSFEPITTAESFEDIVALIESAFNPKSIPPPEPFNAFEPVAPVPRTTTPTDSVAARVVKLRVSVVVAVSPIATVWVAALKVRVSLPTETAAFDGATEKTPRPNTATATSAMRLKVVFVDILFLSVVVMKTFSMAALR
jgi:hypothetical protein